VAVRPRTSPAGRAFRVVAFVVVAIAAYLGLLFLALQQAWIVGASSVLPSDQAFPVALQQTINALSIGAIYALIALGYTMVYGIIELINFAHGDVFMVGAFLAVVLTGGIMGQHGSVTSIPLLAFLLLAALLFTMPLTGGLNMFIERVFYRPFRGGNRLAPLITAVGVSFILQNLALVVAGSGDRAAPQVFPLEWQLPLGDAKISVLSIFIFALAIVLMLLLQTFINRTRLGRAMRATAQDQQAAALMGVDLNQTIALTFLLGGALAGAAGVVWGLRFGYVRQDLGFNAGLKAFTSAVLGGIGNITGAALGGFIIGFIENFASSLGFSRWSEFLVFLVLTLVLIFRPTGILGQQLGDRA
jgi:branched-chain amino acid transport system permease protein